jgi:hypothetical protein
MATKKAAAATGKVAATVSPEPEELQPAGGEDASAPTVEAPLEAVDVFVAEVEDAPPSTITVDVGSCGYYSGARPAETKAEYDTRLGAVANTFGDLGHLLGTKPKI